MTREEAIARIELSATGMVGTLAATTEPSVAEILQRYIDAYDMAISALREQEERSKGCEFCKGAKLGDILVSRRYGDTITYKHRALCCPECGRRLEEV